MNTRQFSTILGLLLVTVVAGTTLLPREARPVTASGQSFLGDVNCDGSANSLDSLLILHLDAGLISFLPCVEDGDVNGDGSIDAEDAWLLIQFCACPLKRLPPEPGATPTPPGLAGDVDCDKTIDSVDVLLVLQLDGGLVPSLRCHQNADVNGDGRIDTLNAALLSQLVARSPAPP